MAERGPYATLIGDLIDSRKVEERAALQRAVNQVLRSVNGALNPVQPLESTVGDEFQGVFESPAAAARASLLLRLMLLKEAEIDSRFGLGYGSVTIFREGTPVSQDGPGWWSAREAIERSRAMASSSRTDFVRTCFISFESGGEEMPKGEARALSAFLISRDGIVTAMRPRSSRLLLGLILKRSQADLAEEEGISQPAVSQDLAASGAYPIAAAELELEGAPT